MSGAREIIAQAFGLVHRNSCYPHASEDECEVAAGVIIGRLQFAGFRLLGPDEIDPVTVERAELACFHQRIRMPIPNETEWDRGNNSAVDGCIAAIRTLTTGGKNGR